MRILVLGAGGVGGYFGGRLVQAGGDVTFLVRERRAESLRRSGLVIHSPLGDFSAPVAVETRDSVRPEFDLALLSCKAYDLDSAIDSVGRGLAPDGRVLPLLNGLAHYQRLDAAFGAERVIGGLCHISVTLGGDGAIEHLNRLHRVIYGERGPERGGPTEAEHIVGDMLRLAEAHDIPCPPLRLAYAHLQTYEGQRIAR